jgi:type II secretory pathway component GspD/PulD (secretin)
MRFALVFCLLLSVNSVFATAETKMKLNAKNEEIISLLEKYSKASGQKFVIDSSVRGRTTIINPEEVSLDEAFNQISEALALNGFAIVKQDNSMKVMHARNAQRDNIEVSETLPAAKPQRMASWVISLKNISAEKVAQQLRTFCSKDGELSSLENTNQLIISDWTSNLQRIAETIKKIDIPATVKK